MQKKCLLIGLLDTQGYESDQRVYSRGGVRNNSESRKPTNASDKEV